MNSYKSSTDKIKKAELTSSIEQVFWTRPNACAGAKAGLEVYTLFVGNNSEIKIELIDKTGKVFETIKSKMSGNKFWKQVTVPEKAKDELYAEVKLTKHNLTKKSQPLYIYPPVQIKNVKWDKKEVHREEVLKMTADVNVYDETEAEVQVYEYDSDNAHDLITKFPVMIKNNKMEAEWEFNYPGDTAKIPTKEESPKGYQWPMYFFRINAAGVSADSEKIKFIDSVEIYLYDDQNNPMQDCDYILTLANSEKIKGKTGPNGLIKEDKIPPGKIKIELTELKK
jgi:hypothetical protein